MKVLVITNNPVLINEGNAFTDSNTYNILKRFSYLGKIRVCLPIFPKGGYTKMDAHLDFMKVEDIIFVKKSKMFISDENLKILEGEVLKSDLIIGYHSPCVNAEAALNLAKKYNKKYMSYVVACAWDGFWNHGFIGKFCAPYRFISLKRVISKSDYALYVSNDFLQKRYPNNGINVGCSDVCIKMDVPSILQNRLNKIDSRRPSDIINLVTVAAINVKYKGQHYVIKALSRLKELGVNNIHYYLYGLGDKSYLYNLAKRYNVDDRVFFMGTVPHNEIPTILDNMDVYIQPSLQEGLPRSVVEAMSRGLLCIGARTAAIPELLDRNYVVERKSIDDIVKQLKNINASSMKKQAVRNYNEALKYQDSELEKKRNAFFDRVINDMKN